jgi:hypothetical protein
VPTFPQNLYNKSGNQNLSTVEMLEIEKKISWDGLLKEDSPSPTDSVIMCVTLIAKEIPQRKIRKRRHET